MKYFISLLFVLLFAGYVQAEDDLYKYNNCNSFKYDSIGKGMARYNAMEAKRNCERRVRNMEYDQYEINRKIDKLNRATEFENMRMRSNEKMLMYQNRDMRMEQDMLLLDNQLRDLKYDQRMLNDKIDKLNRYNNCDSFRYNYSLPTLPTLHKLPTLPQSDYWVRYNAMEAKRNCERLMRNMEYDQYEINRKIDKLNRATEFENMRMRSNEKMLMMEQEDKGVEHDLPEEE